MPRQTDKLDDIHEEAIERFQEVEEAERDQRALAIEDMLFAHAEDGQWNDDDIQKRRNRPRYTLNRVAGAIDQLTGDQRQNRTQIKVRPVHDGNDEVAKIEQGLIRNIESNSDAESIYDAGYDEQVGGGRGGWRVLTEFSDDDSFEQDIVIAPIRSAASSLYLDPSAKKQDKRDAMWGFLIEDVPIDVFNKKYPDASIANFTDLTTRFYTKSCKGWFADNMVRIAEYWRVDLVPTEIALMSDGRVINLKEEEAVIDELAAKGITVVKTRKTKIRKVESYIMNGVEVLKGPMPWAGKFIPLVQVSGRTVYIQGKEYMRGIVRNAKDPQRIYNYAVSTAIETTALTPKDPIWLTAEQAKGREAQLKSFNTQNSPFMIYNSDAAAPGAPQRGGSPAVQTGLIQQQHAAADDIHATTGLYAPAMGNAPQLLSEKSVIAQADKGDRGSFDFTSNLHKAIKYTGDILLDLMPRIFDTPRVVRVLNFDGTAEEVEVNIRGMDQFNQPIVDAQTQEEVIVNDLSRGKYETVIEAGPAFSTQRQESSQQLIDLATGSPTIEQLALDLIVKDLKILDSDELTKRVRNQMIRHGTVEPTDEEIQELGLNQPPPPLSQEEQALLDNVLLQNAGIMADIEKTNADTDKTDAETLETMMDAQYKAIDGYKRLMESYKIQVDSGFNLGITEGMIAQAQRSIIDLSQEGLVAQNV